MGEHPAFHAPANRDVKIWRYLDFSRFVSMLQHAGLYFVRADLLEDKFEGSLSVPLRDYVVSAEPAMTFNQYSAIVRKLKCWSFVSCWHINEFESAAMWKVYSAHSDSICIQSTYARLKRLLPEDSLIGVIRYIDYDREKIPFGNAYWPLVHKRRSFEHERELRAVCGDIREMETARTAPTSGMWNALDLNELIESIYISPTSSEWFKELVVALVEKYQFRIPIAQSDLNREPLF